MTEQQAHDILKQFKVGDMVDITLRGMVVHARVDKRYDENEKEEHCTTEIDAYMNDYKEPLSVDTVDMTDYDDSVTRIISVTKVKE